MRASRRTYARKRSVMFACALACVLVLVSGTVAAAATVSQGRDYAYTTNRAKTVMICDRERDGNRAYTQFVVRGGAKGWRYDKDGAGGYCWPGGPFRNGIYKHNACERVNLWPNRCSSYVYP